MVYMMNNLMEGSTAKHKSIQDLEENQRQEDEEKEKRVEESLENKKSIVL